MVQPEELCWLKRAISGVEKPLFVRDCFGMEANYAGQVRGFKKRERRNKKG